MTTEDMVLNAVPGPRPAWGRATSVVSVSTLVETAQGALALRAAARVLDEYARKANLQIVEIARSLTPDGKHEGVYARFGIPGEEEAPAAEVSALTDQVDKMTSDLTQVMAGVKP